MVHRGLLAGKRGLIPKVPAWAQAPPSMESGTRFPWFLAWLGALQRITACDHHEAVLKLDTGAVEGAASGDFAQRAFAPGPVPAVDVRVLADLRHDLTVRTART